MRTNTNKVYTVTDRATTGKPPSMRTRDMIVRPTITHDRVPEYEHGHYIACRTHTPDCHVEQSLLLISRAEWLQRERLIRESLWMMGCLLGKAPM